MEKNENIELKRIFDILKSKMLLIVFILIAFTLLGYVYSYYYVVPEYKSTATLLLIPNEGTEKQAITATDLNINAELISTYSNIAKQPKVLKQVIQNLNLNMTEQELLNKMQVRILSSTYIIELSVTNTNPQMAMNITKELSNVFLNEIQEIYHLNNIGIIDAASMPQTPSNVNHMKDIATFAVGSIVLSSIIIMAIYLFDNTVKTEEDIERYIKIKTLGKIPLNQNQKQEIIDRKNVKSYITECINTIRTNILYMNAVKGSKAILITSCMPREGKSWVSTNIAVSFAETNKKVLLVDCDMRKGRLHKIFKLSNEEGLSNYLYAMTGDMKKDVKLAKQYIKETQIPNLHIITNGTIPPNPSELIDSDIMKEFIELTKTVYDVVIIDAPPCKLVTDSIILSRVVDSTILVANATKTKMNDLKEVKKSIEIVGGKIIGGVLNQVKMTQKAYGNTYYYGHHDKENKCEVKEKAIISVDEVIEQAMPKFKAKKATVIVEQKAEEVVATIPEVITSTKQVEEQNEHLEQVIDTLSDIKIQLKNNIMESKLNDQEKSEKLEELITKKIEELGQNNRSSIKEELQNMNMTEEIAKILNELETVKANFQITKDDLEYTIKKGMLTKEEVEDIVKSEMITKDSIEEIVTSNMITKDDVEHIVTSSMITKNDVEHIVTNNMITKDEIENIVTSNVLSKENMEDIITGNTLTKEIVEDVVNNNRVTRQDIQEIVANNILSREDITEIVANNNLTREDITQIVANNRLTNEDIERIIVNNKLTSEEIESIVKTEIANKEPLEFLSKEEVEAIVTNNMLTKQDIENIVNNAKLTKQDVENIVRNEMITKESIEDIVANNKLTSKEVETIVTNNMLTKQDVENIVNNAKLTKQDIEQIVQEGKVTTEQLKDMLKQEIERINYIEQMNQMSNDLEMITSEMVTRRSLEEMINNGKLTKQDIEDIVRNEKLTKQEIIAIIRNEMLDKETIEMIVNENKLTRQEVEEIVNNNRITKQDVQEMVQGGKVTKEQVEEILRQQLATINYVEQMNQINEKMMSLQENYLEILNLIKTKQIDLEEPDGENIIHIKSFKNKEQKKKRVYSIQDEMIPYEELEKTAIYVMPLKNNRNEDYEDVAQ